MKKVLFFVITIILGFMLFTVTYQGFYMDNVQGIIQSSLDNKDYDRLAKSFLPFFNKEEQNLEGVEGKYDIIAYEALVGEPVKVKYGDKEVETNRYQESLVLFVDDIEFTVDGKKEGDQFKNYTSVTLYNGDKEPYIYYFNDPMTAQASNQEGVKRFYTDAAQHLKFVMLSISKKDIDEKLGGKVTKLEVRDGHNEVVGTTTCDLDFDSQFYKDVNEIVVEYDKYLKDPENKDVQKAYTDFYEKWYEEYKTNDGYGLAFVKGEISNAPVYWKTAGVMFVYIALCITLGYFMLRKKPTLVQKVKSDKPTVYRTTNKATNKVTEVAAKPVESVEVKEETVTDTNDEAKVEETETIVVENNDSNQSADIEVNDDTTSHKDDAQQD